MKHFYLIGNLSKEGTCEAAQEIAVYLKQHGASCSGSLKSRNAGGHGKGYTDPGQVPPETECVITLGGDGTLIQAARDLIDRQIPLIGINMGNLGYLTQVARGESVIPMLDALLTDNYQLEKRMMLEGCLIGTGGERRGFALNDIVLTGAEGMQVLRFKTSVNGSFLNEYLADGMIVATPTGSTAYNLSAGGPIVKPGAELMVLTPVCSHALNSSSIVLTKDDVVAFEMSGESDRRQMIVFDGDKIMEFGNGDVLEIRKSASYTTLVQLKNISFLENLRNKMSRV
ncbi:MAG: NAD(+)/NADH kinase [Lachnospiraceae bacterium]|nr:NAD(+)/NADH kinase [Lachnospiraceae bacterium]